LVEVCAHKKKHPVYIWQHGNNHSSYAVATIFWWGLIKGKEDVHWMTSHHSSHAYQFLYGWYLCFLLLNSISSN